MGIIRNGGNGAFLGKAGSYIGSRWRDINYIKGIPKISSKPRSLKQLEQQAKFALAISVLMPVKKQLDEGFGKIRQGRTTSFNLALKQLLDHGITGTYPDLEIDYPNMLFAQGRLSGVGGATIQAEPGNLVVSWSNSVYKSNSYPTDVLTALVYEPDSNDYVIGPPDIFRSSGTVNITMPIDWAGKMVHVYVYFTSQEAQQVSNSVYLGSTVIM